MPPPRARAVLRYESSFPPKITLEYWLRLDRPPQCFEDIDTAFLRVLIRPDYEPVNDNRDWESIDSEGFDFRSTQRAFRIVLRAMEMRPSLKIYANLYSPPGWMKANNRASGEGSLKDGHEEELAEYLFAWLQKAESAGIQTDYLSIFNEPGFKHSQDGMHFRDMRLLVECFGKTTEALERLGRTAGIRLPEIVFPDALGPGSITRTSGNLQVFRKTADMLENRVDIWGVHDYWNSDREYWNNRFKELRDFPGIGNKPIWMTEWAQRSPRGDLGSAIDYGLTILNALRKGAQAWMVFEWCHPSGNQSGLISTDWSAEYPRKRYWRSKSYHVFRQIANMSPVGSYVVGTQVVDRKNRPLGKFEYLALKNGHEIILHVFNGRKYPIGLEARLPNTYVFAKATGTTAERNNIPIASIPKMAPPGALLTFRYVRSSGSQ